MNDSKIETLINFISTWPALGYRSAARIVLFMLNKKEKRMIDFASLLLETAKDVKFCINCGNLSERSEYCNICSNQNRNHSQICIVSGISDIWKIEETRSYNGCYYVMYFEDDILSNHDLLDKKMKNLQDFFGRKNLIDEVIMANNSDMKNQGLTYYFIDVIEEIKKERADKNKIEEKFLITSLAKGMPVGSQIEYLDEATISAAIRDRKNI